MNKETIDGVILILSCEKHKYTRLKEFGPSKNNYGNWKVIRVIGDLFLDCNYTFDGSLLTIKCEDSYIHLLKKLALSLKYVYEIYDIKQGVLRCGDDLLFNETCLRSFLISPKYDFYGKAYCGKNYLSKDINLLKQVRFDPFMLNYYKKHQNELVDPKHGINMTLNELQQFMVRPSIWGPAGVIYFLSNRACNIIISTMEHINFNIFHKDVFTNSYPYIIEDVGVTFIMYFNRINFINNSDFFDTSQSIVRHTNKYK